MRPRVLAIGVFVLMSLSLGGRPERSESSPSGDAYVSHNTVVRIDAATGVVREQIAVGPAPLNLRVSAGQIWVQNFGDGTLMRIDPGSKRPVTVPAGKVAGLAVHGSDIWAARDGNRLSQLDGATGAEKRSIILGTIPFFAVGDAGFLAIGESTIWLTVPKLGEPEAMQSLWRIDLASGRVVAKIPIGRDPLPPLIDGDYVWVLTPVDLYQIHISSNRPKRLAVPRFPWGLAAGAGSVWIGNQFRLRVPLLFKGPEVWRLDPATGSPVAKIAVRDPVRGLAFGGGRLWVTTGRGLLSIDPATNQVVRTITLAKPSADEGPIGVAYLGGSVWVSVE